MRDTRAAAVVYASSSVGEIVSDPSDVVESSGRIVRRQKCCDVDVEIEQVADDVRVLGAVEAMEDHRAGFDAGGRAFVEL